MKSFHIVFLLCLVAVFRPASAQDATGYSSIEISDSGVTGIGSTQLDYTSAAYYEVGTSVVLFQGNTAQSLNVISQDNELAPRGLVSGYVSGPFIPNQVYEVLTSHYLRLIYQSGESQVDPNGYSLITDENAYGEATEFPPNQEEFLSSDEVDFLDTYVLATSIPATTLLSDGSLDGAVQDWQDNGDGTFTLKLSPLAYDFLADSGFVAAGAALVFVPGVGEVVLGVGGIVVGGIVVQQLYQWWITHKSDPPPGIPKPKNAPAGTVPIDKFRNPPLTHDQIEQIKGEVLNKPNDWTGIAPDGSVIVGDVNGNAQNKGPWRDLTN